MIRQHTQIRTVFSVMLDDDVYGMRRITKFSRAKVGAKTCIYMLLRFFKCFLFNASLPVCYSPTPTPPLLESVAYMGYQHANSGAHWT